VQSGGLSFQVTAIGAISIFLLAVELGDVAALINLVYQTCIHRIFCQDDLGFRCFHGIQDRLHALRLGDGSFAEARCYSFITILRALDPFLLENRERQLAVGFEYINSFYQAFDKV
jgi:hypothetical protein